MKASLRALLSGAIDYAGLFPPARLPLAEAVANYQRYREGEDAWMLGRFVCPAACLKEVPEGVTLHCAAIGRGGETTEAFLAGLEADVAEIHTCRVAHEGRTQVEVLETKLPGRVLDDLDQLGQVVAAAKARALLACLALFLEAPLGQGIGAVVEACRCSGGGGLVGFKIRTGGLEAAAFPTNEQLADALCHFAQAGIPVKATAGLHHPFPRFDAGVQARMHGFINLLVAGVLARVRGIGPQAARAVLEEEAPAHFRFEDEGMSWRDLWATTEEIERARRETILSFGSCSFDEPRDDLRALGWM